jgi:outer membrane protein OmpA-like peptidoglycan-associated protein
LFLIIEQVRNECCQDDRIIGAGAGMIRAQAADAVGRDQAMIDVRKSMKAICVKAGGSSLREGIAAFGRNPTHRRLAPWLPVAAVLVVAGCSWFSDESTPAPEATPASKTQQSKATPAPGEGEAVGAEQEAQIPDINSVPTEAPKPSIVNLDQAQQGLGADTANAQHTDETLTMPNEQAARPEAPGQENQPETAEATEPAAPAETPPAPAAVAATPETPPTPAPAPAVAAATTPVAAPAPAPVEVAAITGTPQPGSQPFEPHGPLYLTPGSLARNSGGVASDQVAAVPAAPTPIGVTQEAIPAPSPAMTADANSPAPSPAASNSGSSVTVDYSALGIGAGSPSSASSLTASLPTAPAMPSGSVAGVGQAVGLVYFGDGSSGLNDADRNVLRQVAELQRIQGGVLRIIGHASQRTGNLDAQRQDGVNRRVSLARATAVARALVGMGVQPILVQVAAAGDDQTLYAESTPAGEAGNRRAEVYLSQN